MTDEWKTYLNSIYFDVKNPASFSGPEKLYYYVKSEGKFKLGRYRIRQWLQDQESYSLTRGARRRFRRNRVVVAGIDSQWQADLMDMSNIAKDNDSHHFVLLMIDIFSRYSWCEPLKNKTGAEVVKAMKKIFDQGRQPRILQTDKGTEFLNRNVQKYLKSKGIHFFASQNEVKSNYAERCIKTIKHKLFRYILKKRTYRYVNVMQEVVQSYNGTVHRSLGVAPKTVNTANEDEIRLQQYLLRTRNQKAPAKKKSFKYKIGDTVRISHVRSVFDREYSQKWTGELFKIRSRKWRQNLPIYTLEDWNGEDIKGTFYEPEIQVVHVNEDTAYKIENILKRRTRGGQREVLVRWLHWPSKFDSWISEAAVGDYR